jgi:hypothetical protein
MENGSVLWSSTLVEDGLHFFPDFRHYQRLRLYGVEKLSGFPDQELTSENN